MKRNISKIMIIEHSQVSTNIDTIDQKCDIQSQVIFYNAK